MDISMTSDDFDRLVKNASPWAGQGADTVDQPGRWEHAQSPDWHPSTDWVMAYWVGPNWLPVMILREFLAGRVEDFEILYDTSHSEFVILTDYLSPQQVLRVLEAT